MLTHQPAFGKKMLRAFGHFEFAADVPLDVWRGLALLCVLSCNGNALLTNNDD